MLLTGQLNLTSRNIHIVVYCTFDIPQKNLSFAITSSVLPSFVARPVPPACAGWLAGLLPECGSVPWFHEAASVEHPVVCAQVVQVDARRTDRNVCMCLQVWLAEIKLCST